MTTDEWELRKALETALAAHLLAEEGRVYYLPLEAMIDVILETVRDYESDQARVTGPSE